MVTLNCSPIKISLLSTEAFTTGNCALASKKARQLNIPVNKTFRIFFIVIINCKIYA